MTGFWLVIVVAGMVAQERPLSPLESMTQAVAAMSEASLNQAQASRRVHAAMDARRRAIDVLKTHPDRPRWMVDQAVDLFFRAINFRGAAPLAVWGGGGGEQMERVAQWAKQMREMTAAAQQRSGGFAGEEADRIAMQLSFLRGVSAMLVATTGDHDDRRQRLLHEAITVLRPLAYDLSGPPGVIASCYAGAGLVSIGDTDEGRVLLARAMQQREVDAVHATVAAAQLWALDDASVGTRLRWRSSLPPDAVEAALLASDAIAQRQTPHEAITTYVQWRHAAAGSSWSEDDVDATFDQRVLGIGDVAQGHDTPPEVIIARAGSGAAASYEVLIDAATKLSHRQRARSLLLAARAAAREGDVAKARDACLAAADAWSQWADRADAQMVILTGRDPDPRGVLLACATRQGHLPRSSSDAWNVFAMEVAVSAGSIEAATSAIASVSAAGLRDRDLRSRTSRCLLNLHAGVSLDHPAIRVAMSRVEAAWERGEADDLATTLRLALAQRHAQAGERDAAMTCIDRLPQDHDPLTTATYQLAATPPTMPAEQVEFLQAIAAIDAPQAAALAVPIARRLVHGDRWPLDPVGVDLAGPLAVLVRESLGDSEDGLLLVADLYRLAKEYAPAARLYDRIKTPTIEATLGHAEAMRHCDSGDLLGAMARYRRVIESSPPSSTPWWVANLRQLEVLAESWVHLERIGPAINRLRAHDPELGSPSLRRRFQRLLTPSRGVRP